MIYYLGGKTNPARKTDPPEEFESFVAKAAGDELYIKKGYDVPGSDDYHDVWKCHFLAADFVFYLIDVYRIQFEKSEDYRRTISIHQRRLQTWIDEAEPKRPRKLIVVGTYCDKIPVGQRSQEPPRCLVEFRMGLGKHSKRTEIVFGSLKSRIEAYKLIIKIVTTIKRVMGDN